MTNLGSHRQDVNELLKIAGHALYTPLAAIRQAARIIIFENNDRADADFLSDMYAIRDAADQLSDLLDKVWQLLRTDADFAQRTAVNLKAVIERALQRALELHGVRVVSDIPDKLPPINANGEAIEEAIFVLVTRIIRAISEADICLSVSNENDAVAISIRNCQRADFNEKLSLKELLREKEAVSLELLFILLLIQNQGGNIRIVAEANSPNIDIYLSLSTRA